MEEHENSFSLPFIEPPSSFLRCPCSLSPPVSLYSSLPHTDFGEGEVMIF